ncbi:matrixin family metalloprotease [Pseudobacteriovorax antillogorgiicola]|uniref:Peptidase M10 metallopeptidase domain-containing protein n=1 Tax=Pseudobacteriovorax antillogorgiicola TaxID=1513793 RepID=A0A1Y6CB34_9BACT|nr:matrixin family metalloprotease [Pseudobacteriovorax antillogorgiicola]TCS48659.1 hypothetical protein EDD56_11781 [Pseudobacteriovorax antillogorgiicola]SMF55105.1 hypothetical protein SAMN06296036_11778 [Pseudobacteriovorax antillogorgiicola]
MLYQTLASSTLLAAQVMGSWSSGGGKILQDERNPWFLKRHGSIYYCIVNEQSKSGLSDDEANTSIRESYFWWQDQFRLGSYPEQSYYLAENEIQQIACDNEAHSPDIIFQFAWLSERQRDYLSSPEKFVSIAVRTSYDAQLMKGKGFIYVRPQGSFHDNKAHINWQDKAKLNAVLSHEWGHVFGIPHSNTTNKVMSRDFVESIVLNQNELHWQNNVFIVNKNPLGDLPRFGCYADFTRKDAVSHFFGIFEPWDCLGFKLNSKSIEIWISHSHNVFHGGRPIGEIRFLHESRQLIPVDRIWFPDQQTQFQVSERRFWGPAYKIREVSGTYRKYGDPYQRPVGLILDPSKDDPLFRDLKISGILDGRFIVNVLHELK